MNKTLSKEMIKRPRLRNKFLKNRDEYNKKSFQNKGTTVWNAVRDFITLFTKYKTCLFYVIILSFFIIILSFKGVRLFYLIITLSFKGNKTFCLILILSFKENKTFCLILILYFKKQNFLFNNNSFF